MNDSRLAAKRKFLCFAHLSYLYQRMRSILNELNKRVVVFTVRKQLAPLSCIFFRSMFVVYVHLFCIKFFLSLLTHLLITTCPLEKNDVAEALHSKMNLLNKDLKLMMDMLMVRLSYDTVYHIDKVSDRM